MVARLRVSLLPVLLIGLGLVFSSATFAQEKAKSLYLSIGLGQYQDARWPKLKYTSKDAADIDQFLKTSFDRGLLLNDQTNAGGVTKTQILNALEQIRVQNTREDDTIIVYISTHGTIARDWVQGEWKIRKFLVTADSRYDEVAATALAFDSLLDAFEKLPSRRKALIIDSCYSGGGKAVLTPSMLQFIAKQKAGVIKEPSSDRIEGFAVYAASSWGEEAEEAPELQNGVYTHFLLKGFQEDVNGDGAVQLSEAHNFASNAVMSYTKGAQHPSAKVEIIGVDPIIVKGQLSRRSQPSIFTWSWDLRPLDIYFNGKKAGSMGKGFAHVPSGSGQLEIVSPSEGKVIAKRQVEFRDNESYSLETLLAHERLHEIEIGYTALQIENEAVRSQLLPKPLMGPELRYGYRGIFGGKSDLSLRLAYFPSSRDQVEMVSKLGDRQSEGQVDQSLSGFRAGLDWSERKRLGFDSLMPPTWIVHWSRSLAVSHLLLWRQTSLRQTRSEQNETISLLGLSSEQALLLSFKDSPLRYRLGAEVGVVENPYSHKASFSWGLSIGGGLAF